LLLAEPWVIGRLEDAMGKVCFCNVGHQALLDQLTGPAGDVWPNDPAGVLGRTGEVTRPGLSDDGFGVPSVSTPRSTARTTLMGQGPP